MRRRAIVIGTLVAAMAAAWLVPAQAAPPGPAATLAWVKLSSCSRAERTAVFYARVRRVAFDERMWMRFTLLESDGDRGFAPVRAPGLWRWRKSKPGVRALGYRQRVRGLTPGAAYRMRVDFRWYDAAGELVRRARRRSGTCSQAGPQPNLRASLVGGAPTDVPGVTRYSVRVSNAGGAAAVDVKVRLVVDGSVVDTQAVQRLGPGDAQLLRFRGPACASAVEVAADPVNAVTESSESDNVHRLGCGQLPRR